jgi:hypothetical protein
MYLCARACVDLHVTFECRAIVRYTAPASVFRGCVEAAVCLPAGAGTRASMYRGLLPEFVCMYRFVCNVECRAIVHGSSECAPWMR